MSGLTTIRPWYWLILTVACAAVLGIFIALFGQAVWSALIVVNLRTTPAIPWSAAVMALVLWLMWRYLGGRWWPRSTSDARRRRLRTNLPPANVFAWAVLAGALSIVALAGWWLLISGLLLISGSALPDMSKYPWLTTIVAVGMGTLVSPILEEAGSWGYCQSMLEREFSGPTAIVITAIVFALLPHPPMHIMLWPKLILFFFTGLTFGVMAYLTKSILPSLVVHIFGLLAFFTMVFRADAAPGPNAWLWIFGAQMIVFTVLSITAFVRLKRLTEPSRAL